METSHHHNLPSIIIHIRLVHLMFTFRAGQLPLRQVCISARSHVAAGLRPQLCRLRGQFQRRAKHHNPHDRLSVRPQQYRAPQPRHPPSAKNPPSPSDAGRYVPVYSLLRNFDDFPRVRVKYLRPALWALVVSSGIYVGLAYLQAKSELKAQKARGWLEGPQLQWKTPTRGMPTPLEVATQYWADLNPIMKVGYGIIGVNTVVHASSFVMPRVWDMLWHTPARNVNYTQFTSMFVHSGALHFFVNMYALNNFLVPVGYSPLFEGSPYHTLSFFLSAGVLSGFAQHWSTLIATQKRAIPEIFIRGGGASGALFGILGVFCTQYPTAGLGIIFIPVHFDAQYVLPAVMLFDLVGMIRGYSFVNLGHAVSTLVDAIIIC